MLLIILLIVVIIITIGIIIITVNLVVIKRITTLTITIIIIVLIKIFSAAGLSKFARLARTVARSRTLVHQHHHHHHQGTLPQATVHLQALSISTPSSTLTAKVDHLTKHSSLSGVGRSLHEGVLGIRF